MEHYLKHPLNFKVIDVTLRDGGYRNNFNFPSSVTEKILRCMNRSGIDYVEIGYRNGSLFASSEVGPSGLCSDEYLKLCRSNLHGPKMTVMVHPKNVSKKDFKAMQSCGVDAVRVCFPKNTPELGFCCIRQALECGFEVFVNLLRVTQFQNDVMCSMISYLSEFDIQAIYFADSNGSLTPDQTSNLFQCLKTISKKPLGFHAHNNLSLATSNAMSAIDAGANFIDFSLLGYGKGAGNLNAETFIGQLWMSGYKDYDFLSVIEAARILADSIPDSGVCCAKEIIMGILDLSVDDAKRLGEFKGVRDYYAKATNIMTI